MMRFDQNRIKTASKPHAKSAFFTLKIALVISMTYMALAFLGHWPSHGKPMAIAMASSLSQLQVVVFGTPTFHPTIITPRRERGDARLRSLASSHVGDFMAKKPGQKQVPKPDPVEPPKPRPTYTDEAWDEIITRHSAGETIATICRSDPNRLPSAVNVSVRAGRDAAFGKRLTHARVAFADSIFDEAMDIARGERSTPRMKTDAKGNVVVDLVATKADVHRDRLVVDTLLRVVAKINPAKYAERVNINHSGGIDLTGVDDAALNLRIERRLHELGVIELLERWKVGEERLAEFLGLFRVHELPTGPQPIRLLPGETDADVVDL